MGENEKISIANGYQEFPYLAERILADQEESGIRDLQMMRWYESLHFVYVLEGELQVKFLEEAAYISAGQGIFVNQNVIHMIQENGRCQYQSFFFPAYFLSFYDRGPAQNMVNRLVEAVQLPFYVFDEGEEWHWLVLAGLRRLGALEEKKTELYPYEVLVQLANLWLVLLKNVTVPAAKKESAMCVRMRKFLYFIGRHYKEDVTLEELAASGGVSKSECLRCFKKSLDTTPYKYLLDYRLSMAAGLLRNSDRQIGEIAVLTGFDKSSYFGKCFRERFLCTPKEYRNRNRKKL